VGLSSSQRAEKQDEVDGTEGKGKIQERKETEQTLRGKDPQELNYKHKKTRSKTGELRGLSLKR